VRTTKHQRLLREARKAIAAGLHARPVVSPGTTISRFSTPKISRNHSWFLNYGIFVSDQKGRKKTMIFGMSLATYTLLHVLISLIGIGSGAVVMFGLLNGRRSERTTAVFLVTTALASITGFGFPFEYLMPSHILGILSLFVLAFAIPAMKEISKSP